MKHHNDCTLEQVTYSQEPTWFKELAEAATIMVPMQVQQSAGKSTALLLPKTNPVPDVATTSMLESM